MNRTYNSIKFILKHFLPDFILYLVKKMRYQRVFSNYQENKLKKWRASYSCINYFFLTEDAVTLLKQQNIINEQYK